VTTGQAVVTTTLTAVLLTLGVDVRVAEALRLLLGVMDPDGVCDAITEAVMDWEGEMLAEGVREDVMLLVTAMAEAQDK
jgi:hypothetical protein